ncbi:cAMP-binding domain of CRP or a regulatory subunit of cAMP-dependent protein kinases [Cruoricaptor ignavus]|uniref:cAMP-binding domain of CRP or a regulatory subunit of cAMP-dependent protein kinases n=2 Tax=Cruoricaptor ignavus TaxID=1118202 RepID=A0A1M6HV60_9FLAO|nr:cAMP-binding domain of CRP or a regulatory subunit of cAMP-dependent protein kinases [Cruoricaptor ignavus]
MIKIHFEPLDIKKKKILIEKNSPCNKLFFVNKGLLRAFYIDSNGNEFTRRISWESGFLTNMDSFRKNGIDNNETIECIENAEILQITKKDLDLLLSGSENLAKVYQAILEKYMAINIRRYHHISTSTPLERLIYFNKNYPSLKNRINDSILASFLSISRKTLIRTKQELIRR